MLHLRNTLTGSKDSFSPVRRTWYGKPVVDMYHCGPTVYNFAHIGNLRAYVFADTLKRLMKAEGYKVKQVINITDVGHLASDADTGEDKMQKARQREHKSAWDIAKFYTAAFMSDLADLNIDTDGTVFPRATGYIKQQISIVQTLEKKGYTYKTSDGIYFDTAKFPAYGKLGNIDLAGLRNGERIGVNDEKKNPTDFALWKFSPVDGEKRDMEWDSPWGVGFPGWHIECSAMAMSILGETIDIHTGGIDHIPVHHNNEIAQSEGSTGKQFSRFWMHSAFVNVSGGKMAKSEGNFITLATLKEKGFSAMDYRYLLLGARYSTPVNFTWESLEAAQSAYKKMSGTVYDLPSGGTVDKEIYEKALSYIADDLDTPNTLALVWEVLKAPDIKPADKKATVLKIDALLGLAKPPSAAEADAKFGVPADVQALADERKGARAAKDWKRSDELRDQIVAKGFSVKDFPEGQKIARD